MSMIVEIVSANARRAPAATPLGRRLGARDAQSLPGFAIQFFCSPSAGRLAIKACTILSDLIELGLLKLPGS